MAKQEMKKEKSNSIASQIGAQIKSSREQFMAEHEAYVLRVGFGVVREIFTGHVVSALTSISKMPQQVVAQLKENFQANDPARDATLAEIAALERSDYNVLNVIRGNASIVASALTKKALELLNDDAQEVAS